VTRYTVYVTPDALGEIRRLPGHMRQRVRRAISDLGDDARPPASSALSVTSEPWELRRVRLDRWRILYGVVENEGIVDVLAVRRRPPYDYGDLQRLVEDLGG
jgi:mRNA interferase RelE/StbE